MSIDRREAIKRMALAGLFTAAGPISNLVTATPSNEISKYFKYSLNKEYPEFDYFSVDSLGTNKLENSPLILTPAKEKTFSSKIQHNAAKYYLNGSSSPAWEFEVTNKGFILRSNYVKGNVPWQINFLQNKNHATVLGIVPEKNKIETPSLLHLPDMGSIQIRSKQVKVLDYTASRKDIHNKYVKISFPAASKEQKFVEYSFDIVAIYPEVEGIEKDPRFDGYRRNYLNTFQVNPNWMILSNNSTSDSCAFVQYGYSELAVKAPALVDDLTAIDLVKMTIDRYLDGQKGYGMFGYYADFPGTENVQWGGQNASLDTYPSLLMAACNYYKVTRNKEWLSKKYKGLLRWAEEILSRDKDGDGILEYGFSGNTGSWSGSTFQRPANWWDTIGFGHKDAYSNALAYRALNYFAELCRVEGDERAAKRYVDFAAKMKKNYHDIFINPETGVLAGWKSEDGELHDYYFTFVNGMAIAYGLVSKEQGNKIMDAMLAKLKDVGFRNFELGLPGNLISIPRGDYTHHDPRWGGHTSDEKNDGWQHYENGGTSGNYVYFTLKALYRLGRRKDAETILFPLLKAYNKGSFQGECDNGMTPDWRTWDGECWGYEGFLVDNYWALLIVAEEY